ncbi:MAG: hypothetical protein HY700_11160 [Gemmatimonadetes bacterium]|nr:hypothetical protein [Gemmatimonadota bacterium]
MAITALLRRAGGWVAAGFYALIMIEVIVMISPFAIYWYALYTPTLQTLHQTRWTAWMESFFLPHSVVSNSALLEFLRWKVGPYLLSIGLLAFLALALQLYSAKLRKKGVVSGGIYRYIRHPQYVSLAIAGIGLLTLWPRLIILVLYLGMLIAYYLLARSEEGRMLRAHPTYADYQQRTAMFLPGNPGAHVRQWLFGWVRNPTLGAAFSCAALFIAGMALGLGLRQFSIAHVSKVVLPEQRLTVFPAWPEDASRVNVTGLVQRVLGDSGVSGRMLQEGNAAFAVHLLPVNYGMVNMFTSATPRAMTPQFTPARFRFVARCLFPFLTPGDHQGMGRPGEGKLKVIVSRVSKPDADTIRPEQTLDLGVKMTPVAVVDADAATGEIVKRDDPGRGSGWGPVTMPIF